MILSSHQSARLLRLIEAADSRISVKEGYRTTPILDWFSTLLNFGVVEIGWRECCGCADPTIRMIREWRKIAKQLERYGVRLTTERVKHKNSYATIKGGFWNSEILRLHTAEGAK